LDLRIDISIRGRYPVADDRDRLGDRSGHLHRKRPLGASRTRRRSRGRASVK
jgi:hypothetical protein